jgi:hypothetical protein
VPFTRHMNTRRPPPFTVQLTKSLEKVYVFPGGFRNKARAVPFRVGQ